MPVIMGELVIARTQSPPALRGANAIPGWPGLLAGGDGHQLNAAIIFHHPGQAHQQLLAG